MTINLITILVMRMVDHNDDTNAPRTLHEHDDNINTFVHICLTTYLHYAGDLQTVMSEDFSFQ